MNSLNASRAIAAALLLTLLMALTTAAVGASTAEDFCDRWDSGTATASDCETTGQAAHIGFNNFEPTMGVTPEGGLYMATTPARGVAVGWRAGVAKATSLEAGLAGTWTDVQPGIAGYSNPPETNDPYGYVDPSTGRIFSFHMAPILLCSILSFSDDGGATWTTPPIGCGPSGAWDHQTMVAAPPTPGTIMLGDYPNVLVQCVNSVYAEMCARSLDGGLTWGSGYPAYRNPNLSGCGTQTGHLAADPDGVIYLPTPQCGNRASVYVSTDSGLTWTERVISNKKMPFTDPAIDIDADGLLHATWITSERRLMYSVSQDKAVTWTTPVAVTPPGIHAELPALVAGDGGNIAIAFAATKNLPQGYQTQLANARDAAWGAYLSVATDADAGGTPTFDTVNATGADPIQRGTSCSSRCLFLVDFIDVVITPDGVPVAAFSDGCTNDACISGAASNNVTDRGKGLIAVADVDLCAETCHHFTPAAAAASSVTGPAGAPTTSLGAPYNLRTDIGEARFQQLLEQHLDGVGFSAQG